MRARYLTALVMVLSLIPASAALGDTADSSNWAGYAIHRTGTSFRGAVANWTQPSVTCTPGKASYSAQWVGLGGYNQSSNALEQIGTEVDCTLAGRKLSSAWYELVPAPSTPIKLKVSPGDKMAARVTVNGRRVLVAIYDATTHHSFSKTVTASRVDVSSAEWIVEAPSACISIDACQTLPLANFGSTSFYLTGARSTTGHRGAISDPAWQFTQIRLTPGSRRFVAYQGVGPVAGVAVPTALQLKGTSFGVSYSEVSLQGNPFLRARAAAGGATYPPAAGSTYLMH